MNINLTSLDEYVTIFGQNDQHAKLIENMLDVKIKQCAGVLQITGEEKNVSLARDVFASLLKKSSVDIPIDTTLVTNTIFEVLDGSKNEEINKPISFTYKGKPIYNKTRGQRIYTDAILNNTLTIAAGPAGTGKTFLAIALAVNALKNRDVERLILTRPAVEAGEKLGFLPGDMSQKIDPYLRPLYDALFEMIGAEGYQRFQERGMIEVAPLAFMRGRTLSNSFIILDEAQNTTQEQMKMFLTRLGNDSKCVVAGDLTQIDLPLIKKSGLKEAMSLLKNVEGIKIVTLGNKDVVRNDIVQKIVMAYENKNRSKIHDEIDNTQI